MFIYATGTTGYIGSHLRDSIPLIVDLSDRSSFSELKLKPKSTLIHLASIVGVQRVMEDSKLAYQVNVEGTVRLAENLRNHNDTRLIYVSTSHVYKYSGSKHSEDSETEPMSEYAKQKLEAELRLRELYADAPHKLLIARVFSILGQSMPRGTLGWAIERANLDNPIRYSDDMRDFSTAAQVAGLLEKLANKDWHNPILNVCSGVCRSVRSAGIELRKNLNLRDDENIFLPGNSSIPQNCGDNRLLIETLANA